MTISATASTPACAQRVSNLDALLNLATRWTREFKAEYVSRQSKIKRRIDRGEMGDSMVEIEHYVRQEQADLSPLEPNYEVHRALLSAMLEQERLAAWQMEVRL
jgi:ATP-dependent protease HslVU (ClpYQ) ATPase subunit